MLSSHTGELAALLVALFWTVTALAFESATKKVGSVAVNLIRLLLALLFLGILNYVRRDLFFPLDASTYQWFWLAVSGLIGFVIGDLFLFKSYPLVGSWFAMLIMTLAPPTAAVLGFFILGERMDFKALLGMILTLSGISLAIFSRKSKTEKLSLNKPVKGILYALIGAVGQGSGIVFSKLGMQEYDPFAATQIRIIAGVVGFMIIITLWKRWKPVTMAFVNKRAMWGISTGAFFGPFLGVSFSLVAIKYTQTGIASTIMAIVPILIIPPSILIFQHRISLKEILGVILGVAGVVFFFL
jgi:drug/metabolite transporter (DMT)-like permease